MRVVGYVRGLMQAVALGGMQHARDHLERGRLARAVGAEQHVDLPLIDVQRYVVHRRLGAASPPEAFHEPMRFQNASRHVVSFLLCRPTFHLPVWAGCPKER